MPVNNDFHNTFDLFELFKDLTVKEFDVEVSADSAAPDGEEHEPNGKPTDSVTKN